MKKIMSVGSVRGLESLMKLEGYKLVNLDMPLNTNEEKRTYILEQDHYNHEVRVVYQVNEIDENDLPIAINVVKIECELVNKQ